MKDFFDKKLCQNLVLVIIGIIFASLLINIHEVAIGLGLFIGLFTPLIFGGAIAFILNVPMHFFERKISRGKDPTKRQSVLALLITIIVATGAMVFMGAVIIPNVVTSCKNVALAVSDAYPQWLAWLSAKGIDMDFLEQFVGKVDYASLVSKISSGALKAASSALGSVFGTVGNIGIGIVFAIYILLAKKKLGVQAKKLLYAFTKKEWADEVCAVGKLSYNTFAKFLSGQCVEAVILGTMFCIVLTIGRFPYAISIGAIIGALSLIPIVGAFIGLAFGVLLIGVVSIKKAIIFIAIFLILQQIEGNLIYPKVVGGSIGLPAIWTLLAVIIGGKVAGIVGIVVFIPLFSILYALIRRAALNRLAKKEIVIR